MTISRPFVLIGAGGHAKVVAATVLAAGHRVVAAYDDDRTRWGSTLLGIPIAGPVAAACEQTSSLAILGIGSNAARAHLAATLPLEWGTLIHPRAWVHESVRLGLGTVVFAGALMQPDTAVGSHVIINTAASVDHDCTVEDFAHLAPGVRLAGGVHVGRAALVGVGASAIPGVRIGDRATIGAGAAVVRDIADDVTAVGVPARPVRAHT